MDGGGIAPADPGWGTPLLLLPVLEVRERAQHTMQPSCTGKNVTGAPDLIEQYF